MARILLLAFLAQFGTESFAATNEKDQLLHRSLASTTEDELSNGRYLVRKIAINNAQDNQKVDAQLFESKELEAMCKKNDQIITGGCVSNVNLTSTAPHVFQLPDRAAEGWNCQVEEVPKTKDKLAYLVAVAICQKK